MTGFLEDNQVTIQYSVKGDYEGLKIFWGAFLCAVQKGGFGADSKRK